MKIQKSLLFFVTLILSLLFLGLVYSNSSAQAYRGLIIDALRFDYNQVQPGSTVNGNFNVSYDYRPEDDGSYKSVNLILVGKDFTQGEQAGIPKFYSEGELPETSAMSNWITYNQDTFTLSEPGEKHRVEFSITVPQNADPGGKYSAIFIANNSGDAASEQILTEEELGLGLNSSLAPLLFLTVQGDIERSLELNDFYTTNVKGQKTSFFFNLPVNFVAEFQNNGNVHVAPRGKVYVHRAENFVSDNIASFELNPVSDDGYRTFVLPNTARGYTSTWDKSFIVTKVTEIRGDADAGIKLAENDEGYMDYPVISREYSTEYDWDKLSKLRIGSYKVTLQYDYENENGEYTPVTTTISFFIFPWQLIIFLVVITLCVAFVILSKKYRKQAALKQSK